VLGVVTVVTLVLRLSYNSTIYYHTMVTGEIQ
jgi:hypothetical protein